MDIHYFAAARAARGEAVEQVASRADSLETLLAELGKKHTKETAGGMTLAQIFERCTFLINGSAAELSASLAGAKRVDILPPFAGG